MDRTIHLALYGSIQHGLDDDLAWDLYQSAALSRLRDVSLSSVPSRFAPHGVATSRFQHSVAVGYLARRLAERRNGLREHRQTLVAAGICHDIGSPPFSHVAEAFLYDLTGKTHEEQTEDLLSPGGELARVLRSYEVDPVDVVEIITGRHPRLGALIAGTIDLDNVSNTIDLLVSIGYHDDLPYHPLSLIDAFRYRDGKVMLDSTYLKELLGWVEARRRLYGLLYSEANLSAMATLYRALEYAYAEGALGEEFFRLGESDALHYLRFTVGGTAAKLVEEELRWRHYPLLYERLARDEDPRLAAIYGDWRARRQLADELAAGLRIPPDELSFYVGRERGEKTIRLPFIGENADAAGILFGGRAGQQRLAIFAHKRHHSRLNPPRVERVVNSCLAELRDDLPETHVFC